MRRNIAYKIMFLSFARLLFPLKIFAVDKTTALLHNPYFNSDGGSIALGIKIMCRVLSDCFKHHVNLESYPP